MPFTASDPLSWLSRVEPQAISPTGLLQESSGQGVLRKRLWPVANRGVNTTQFSQRPWYGEPRDANWERNSDSPCGAQEARV